MKKIIPVFILLATSYASHSQEVVISNERQNIVYLGVPNPLKIAAEGYHCKDISLNIDSAEIIPGVKPCQYVASFLKPGKAYAIVKEKSSGKILDTVVFNVKNTPDPVAKVAGKQGGDIRKNILVAQAGIIAVLEGVDFDFDARFVVTAYTASIIRNDKLIFTKSVNGPRFPAELTKAWKDLEVGDKVLFNAIEAIGPDKRLRQLLPVELRII